ncbi:MAG: hypothetical protein ABSE18_00500 [Minisyncoccia bacterium]
MREAEKKSFLEELQSLDETTKTKILVVATAVAMIIVIYVWLAYFNSLIAGVAQEGTASSAASSSVPSSAASSSAVSSGGTSIWQNVEGGIGTLYGKSVGFLHYLGNILQAPRQYIVKPPQ